MNRKLACALGAAVLLLAFGGTVFAAGSTESATTRSGQVETLSYYGFSEWVGDPKVGPVYQELAAQFAE